MTIEINNLHPRRQVQRYNVEMFLQFLLSKTHRRDPHGPWQELSVVFTDDVQMTELHERLMGDPTSTDVMAVRYDSAPFPGATEAGELMVNIDRALQAWPGHGQSHDAHRELALYLAHGMDHLSGADDSTEPGRRSMRQRELRWLREAETQGAFRRPLIEGVRDAA